MGNTQTTRTTQPDAGENTHRTWLNPSEIAEVARLLGSSLAPNSNVEIGDEIELKSEVRINMKTLEIFRDQDFEG